MCLYNTRTSIFVNGSPTGEFRLHRGLRQGDAISPFLFLIVMEGLHLLLKSKVEAGLIQGVRVGNSDVNISHLFYADDVIILSEWNRMSFLNTIAMYTEFYNLSGLKINVAKSHLYGIGVADTEVDVFVHDMGCSKGRFPFTYLGLPIGVNMNYIVNWKALVNRFVKKLSDWNAKLLSIGGRLTLIKSVLGSLGVYYLSLFKCPETILDKLESLRAGFFWGSTEIHKKIHWIAWDQVLASFDKGGMNIGSLRAYNYGLLFKWLWHFINYPNSMWVMVLKALHDKGYLPNNVIRAKVGNGQSIHFWKDNWLGIGPLKDKHGRLFHLDQDEDCSLADRVDNENWRWVWRRDIGSRNSRLLDELVMVLGNPELSNSSDKWQWAMDEDNEYTVHNTHSYIDDSTFPTNDCHARWCKFIPRKINVFMWRVALDRLPSRDMLSRRGVPIDYIGCEICTCGLESVNHVMFGCDLAMELWPDQATTPPEPNPLTLTKYEEMFRTLPNPVSSVRIDGLPGYLCTSSSAATEQYEKIKLAIPEDLRHEFAKVNSADAHNCFVQNSFMAFNSAFDMITREEQFYDLLKAKRCKVEDERAKTAQALQQCSILSADHKTANEAAENLKNQLSAKTIDEKNLLAANEVMKKELEAHVYAYFKCKRQSKYLHV
ncbi:uncharacterized protein [Rutidosis leptorrhynchoides]|uniref:uncharacterized protein n=1 Tax=Rutidosis leptorrhynchoides TaxID=125765 RepID=UPI003A991FF5